MFESFSAALRELNPASEDYVPQLVDLILQQARFHRASDVHLIPREDRLLMQWRIDGVLHDVAVFEGEYRTRVVARLKVLAGLLTYRTDVPQEGRIAANVATATADGEVRISTFPTLHGEKAAVRLFAKAEQYELLKDLGLPDDIYGPLRSMLETTSGVILLSGPSGSGKTTSAYACLREIVQTFETRRGVLTLEDPIESILEGVTQSQVRPHVGFDLTTGLKSMMRQDPDVIFVGEIRDPDTAEAAFQAALTGHLVITTFHAGSSADAVTRLLDLNIEPYLIRSALRGVICQRLIRRKCTNCSGPSDQCEVCGNLGFQGRMVTAELLDAHHPGFSQALMDKADSNTLAEISQQAGMISLSQRARELVAAEKTTHDEVFRVLGVRMSGDLA